MHRALAAFVNGWYGKWPIADAVDSIVRGGLVRHDDRCNRIRILIVGVKRPQVSARERSRASDGHEFTDNVGHDVSSASFVVGFGPQVFIPSDESERSICRQVVLL